MVTPDEVLRNCVEGAAKFVPGATMGQVREVADRVAKWLDQAGYEVVRREPQARRALRIPSSEGSV